VPLSAAHAWIHRQARIVAAIYIVVVPLVMLALASFSVYDHYTTSHRVARLAAEGAEAHQGVCALRRDLQTRVRSSVLYLQHHPQGIPALGITADDLRQSITIQEQYAKSLAHLHCDP